MQLKLDNTRLGETMCSGKGQFDSRLEADRSYDAMSLYYALKMPPGRDPKSNALWIIPSSYKYSDARKHKTQRLQGEYHLLTADIDCGNHGLNEIKEAIVSLFGQEYLTRIYSTGSATIDNRKWRVLIPLAIGISFDLWHRCQIALNDWLEDQWIITDRVLERSAQLVYLPNVSENMRNPQGDPEFYESELFGDDLLDPEKPGTKFSRFLAEVTDRERAEEVQKQKRAAALLNKPKPSLTDSVVDAFNAAYSIEELLVTYGYIQSPNGRDWRSPNQEGKSYATRDYGDHWVSLSGSDANAGLGRKTSSGCFGDAFDLFVFYEYAGDIKSAVKEIFR
jgi:hypothetical protein